MRHTVALHQSRYEETLANYGVAWTGGVPTLHASWGLAYLGEVYRPCWREPGEVIFDEVAPAPSEGQVRFLLERESR